MFCPTSVSLSSLLITHIPQKVILNKKSLQQNEYVLFNTLLFNAQSFSHSAVLLSTS